MLIFCQNQNSFCFQCLTHTHQLAIDFQLFIMAIPLMYLLRKSKAVALFVIAAIMSASTILRYQAVKNNDLATVVYFGSKYAYKLYCDGFINIQFSPFGKIVFNSNLESCF